MYCVCYLDKIMHDRIKSDILDSYKDVVDFLFRKCNKSEQLGNIPVRVSDTLFDNSVNIVPTIVFQNIPNNVMI